MICQLRSVAHIYIPININIVQIISGYVRHCLEGRYQSAVGMKYTSTLLIAAINVIVESTVGSPDHDVHNFPTFKSFLLQSQAGTEHLRSAGEFDFLVIQDA